MTEIPLRIDEPKGGKALRSIVLAHGAGAGMDSTFMKQMAEALAACLPSGCPVRVPLHAGSPDHAKAVTTGPAQGARRDVDERHRAGRRRRRARDRRQVDGGTDREHGGRSGGSKRPRVPGVSIPPGRQAGHAPRGTPREAENPDASSCRGPATRWGAGKTSPGTRCRAAIRIVYLEDGDHSFKPRKSSGRSYDGNFAEAVTAISEFSRTL